jgi:hypothetical protein
MHIAKTPTLFKEFIRVVNRMLEAYPEHPKCRESVAVFEEQFGGAGGTVAMRAADAGKPVDHFGVAFRDGQFELIGRGNHGGPVVWNLPVTYLKDAVDRQEEFLEDPARFNWRWLHQRPGVPHEGRT